MKKSIENENQEKYIQEDDFIKKVVDKQGPKVVDVSYFMFFFEKVWIIFSLHTYSCS